MLALGSPIGLVTVAEGLASGELNVVNRHSVSPGGLRWIDSAPDIHGEWGGPGCWALGTGFVSLRYDATDLPACTRCGRPGCERRACDEPELGQ
jgi:hypothetical protein